VIWNRRRWTVNPTPGTTGQSEIIGVSPDFALDTRRQVLPQILYVDPISFSVLSVRLVGSQIPEALTAIDASWSQIMHTNIHRRFLSQRLQDMYADIILQGTAITLGVGLAVAIAALGLFGLSAHSAEQRTKEIGIRKSMGAGTGDIMRLLMWQFTKPVLWANLLAWPLAAWLMTRWLETFAHHIDLPLWLFPATGAVTLTIALLTVSVHSILVARAKPVAALRYE
jgi:putative ABC transport system permease protein